MWGMAMTLLALPMVGRLTRGYQPPPAPTQRRRMLRAIRIGDGRPQLSAAAPGFHLRLSYAFGHPPARRGESARAAVGGQLVAQPLSAWSNIVGSLYAGACVSRYRSNMCWR